MPTKPTGRPVGRPTLYSEEAADKIIDGLYDGLDMIQSIERAGFKNRTVYEWMQAHPDFRERCAHARDALTEIRLNKLRKEIAEAKENGADPALLRVLASHEQWEAERIAPKLYSSRTRTEISGPGGGPVQIAKVDLSHLDEDQLEVLEQALNASIDNG